MSYVRAIPAAQISEVQTAENDVQQELAYLAGLSRQRVNEALRRMEDRALIRIEYGGLRILDMEGLRRSLFEQSGDNR